MNIPNSGLKEWIRPYYLKWIYAHLSGDRYPSEFTDCWRYPAELLRSGIGQWLGNAGAAPDVLFLPACDWHARIQRTQHLATELAQMGHRCFYLNPHLGREFPRPYPLSSRRVVSLLLPKIFELHVHLPREPIYHHRSLTAAENSRVVSAIEQFLSEAKSKSPVIFVSFPLWHEVTRVLRERRGCRVIYDCHDLWAGFQDIHPGILATEAQLFDLSDLVLFSSRWLMHSKNGMYQHARTEPVLLHNAVRAQDFDFSYPRRSGRKRVGYAGSLHFWFDVEAVRLAAQRHPEWEFALFGRVEESGIGELRNLSNVRLMGEVPYSTLRHHLSSIDVGIIPFRLSPLTVATNPLKLYEYFACGLPVVSSPLPEVQEYRNLVYFAKDPEEFVGQLERAMEENDPAIAAERRLVAEQESWTARCRSLVPHLVAPRAESPAVPLASLRS